MARVVVDTPLAHLDRPFDYVVPDADLDTAVPGARVRVPFAGRLVDGFILDRVTSSEHGGRLSSLHRLVSPEPVLTPEIAALARAVADRYAGTLVDVLRLAVPKRHARVEAEPPGEPAAPPSPPEPGSWDRYESGAAFLSALAGGGSPRALWRALPGSTWPAEIAVAVQACLASGRGAVVVAPDARDVARVDAALRSQLGSGLHVVLTAELGPPTRYRRFLHCLRGSARCVVGTRSAAWAPIADVGLVVLWDDGDDVHKEQRAPYAHVREVLALRAHRAGAAALIGGFTPSVEAEQLVVRGWAHALSARRQVVRATAPHVEIAGSESQLSRDPAAARARLPTLAWQTARDALRVGEPVLVQVPRSGYQPTLACDTCRTPARCTTCAGPLARVGNADTTAPSCRWCGRPQADWACVDCRGRTMRALVVGSRRTAEELGRAFPGVIVRTSDRDGVLRDVAAAPALVVATPGAEPVAEAGYGAVLLLDGWALLVRADLRAGEEALRRWCAAAALARPGGHVVLMADPGVPAVQALVRWDPATLAGREYEERAELGLPPAVRMAAVDGQPDALADLLAILELPVSADILGPVPHGDAERALIRTPWEDGVALAQALHSAQAVRSARKAPDPVRIEMDPLTLL